MTVTRCPVCGNQHITRFTQPAPYTERHIELAHQRGITLDLSPRVTVDCRDCGFTMAEAEIETSDPARFADYHALQTA